MKETRSPKFESVVRAVSAVVGFDSVYTETPSQFCNSWRLKTGFHVKVLEPIFGAKQDLFLEITLTEAKVFLEQEIEVENEMRRILTEVNGKGRGRSFFFTCVGKSLRLSPGSVNPAVKALRAKAEAIA